MLLLAQSGFGQLRNFLEQWYWNISKEIRILKKSNSYSAKIAILTNYRSRNRSIWSITVLTARPRFLLLWWESQVVLPGLSRHMNFYWGSSYNGYGITSPNSNPLKTNFSKGKTSSKIVELIIWSFPRAVESSSE